MRYEAIELVRYGRYADRSLRFSRGECDFHLILGRNEAGKSTLRQAFHDLLFGIPMNTPMSFLHHGSELELRAVVSGAAGELAFGRRRKRNGGLVDARGEPLPAEALRSWLGEVGEAFYERMFGLDHRRLEQGGRAMLQAADNVDSVLFQAAAGVSALNGVLGRLREEADGLWAPRRSRERAWYAAATRLAEAEADLKAATVRPSAWREAQRESTRLDRAFAEAEAAHRQLLLQKRELERLRRSAPLLAQIRRYESLLAESRDAEGDDGARLLLVHGDDILALEESRPRIAEYRGGIAEHATRMALLGDQLADVLRQLGRSAPAVRAGELDALASALPARPLLHEIGQLLQAGRQNAAQRRLAREALDERRSEAERLRNEIAGLPAVSVRRRLRLALDAVVAAGDLDSMMEAAQRHCDRQRAALQRRLQALSQPGLVVPAASAEALEWLARMDPWPAAALSDQLQQRQRLHADIESLAHRMRDARLESQAAALALEQFRRSHQAVSRDEVLAVRRERDALWQALQAGLASIEAEGGRFGMLMEHADSLADLHLQAVGDAARLQGLQHEHERCEHALHGLLDAHRLAGEALARFDAHWEEACRIRRLPVLPPSELQGWLAARDAVLSAQEDLVAAQREADALGTRHDALLADLLDALAEEGDGIGETAGSLAEAREQAMTLLHDAERAQARRQALDEQLARVTSQLPAVEKQHARHEAEHEAWQQRWQRALERAGLPHDAQEAYVEAALGLFSNADELLAQLRECAAESERMNRALQDHAQAVEALARSLEGPGIDLQDTDALVRRWVTRLERARAAEREREGTGQRLAELNERLLQEGEGRSREQIEAELDAVDISTLAIQSETLDTAIAEAAASSNRLAVERQQARSALDAISGGDAAATAEARRQEALADMADVAERYVSVHAQSRLLEWVMERYRDRRQGPLLSRAGQLFSDLTLGAHGGLVVDPEEKLLHARRADGSLVPLDGLSDGTRDQLYLALRLAALELYLDSAPPMPFIADDLFVNYDDRRAVASLRRLGEVAQRTQVIFLTHHAHMVELAQEALSGKLHLIELPQPD